MDNRGCGPVIDGPFLLIILFIYPGLAAIQYPVVACGVTLLVLALAAKFRRLKAALIVASAYAAVVASAFWFILWAAKGV